MDKNTKKETQEHMPSAEEITQELDKATSIDEFYGKDPILQNYIRKLSLR